MLLSYAELPLLYRARACGILALSSNPGYVEWAEEAVRTVELGIERWGNADEHEEMLLREYRQILEQARRDFEECGGYEEEAEEAEEEAEEAKEKPEAEAEAAAREGEDEVTTEAGGSALGMPKLAAELQTPAPSSPVGPREGI